MMAVWARGKRFWNLYTQLGLRLAILVTYIVCLAMLIRGTKLTDAKYILGYCMVGVSLVYNGIHVNRLYTLLVIERRPGQSKYDTGCVMCLEILAAIVTALVGIGTMVVDGLWGSFIECSGGEPYCDAIIWRHRYFAEQAFYVACCLWAVSVLHFFLIVLASIQCCTNRGLNVPESALRAAQLRQAGAVRETGQSRRAEEDHELPVYRPRDSTILEERLVEEPPPYVARPPSIECPRPAVTSGDNCPR